MKYSAEWTEINPQVRKFLHVWEPASVPTAVVCIVHGLGEHGGRYRRLAADLVRAGLAVVAFDQQGHGQSPGKRGCIDSYEALLIDIGMVLRWADRCFPDIPRILFGHSMGGNLVLNYVLRMDHPPEAMISSSPMIRSVREPGWLFESVARMLLTVAPNFRLKSNVVAERLMSDREEQQEFYSDALFHSRLSLRLGAALLDSGRWMLDNAQKLQVPTLLVHGTNDYLTSHIASAEFAKRAAEICQLELYEGQLHDTFRDRERDRVIERFVEFIRQHCT